MSARFSECKCSVTGHDAGGTQDGTCTWCGVMIDVRPAPDWHQPYEPSDLRDAYDYHHDPDYGALTPDQIAERYRSGRES